MASPGLTDRERELLRRPFWETYLRERERRRDVLRHKGVKLNVRKYAPLIARKVA